MAHCRIHFNFFFLIHFPLAKLGVVSLLPVPLAQPAVGTNCVRTMYNRHGQTAAQGPVCSLFSFLIWPAVHEEMIFIQFSVF